MPVKRLKDFLESHHVQYVSLPHSPAFTAQEIAAAAHVSGKKVTKIVMVKIDNQLAMIVLPANSHINFATIKEAMGAAVVDLATEADFKNKFPECEVGAMPPFGNLYDIPVYVSNELTGSDQIIFNGGSHSELVKMSYQDFERLVKPKILSLH